MSSDPKTDSAEPAAPAEKPEATAPSEPVTEAVKEPVTEPVREPAPAAKGWRAWWFMAVPAVAVVELVAQGVIQARVPSPGDWRAASTHITRQRREGDLVASAPVWTDPLARMYFRDLVSLADAARPDATRYARAWVATIRGAEHPDFAGWREESSARFGRVTVRLLVNPTPARVLYDFVDHLRPPDASASREESGGRRECQFQTGLFVAGGGLSQGALAPPERFACSAEGWNYVGVTILEDMQHRGRRCIWSHPVANGAMVTRYADVPMGTTLHGHHAIAYEAERGDDNGNDLGGPVELRVFVDDTHVGTAVHRDGEGWKAFDFDTRAFAGTRHAVRFEVRAERVGMRHYCFEGDTR